MYMCAQFQDCAVTTAISINVYRKEKSPLDHGIHEYNEKGGELPAMYCLNYCTRNWRDCSDTVC